MKIDIENIKKARAFWENFSGADLDAAEADEIIRNVSEFIGILQDWNRGKINSLNVSG